jgi:hypothetical protein
MPVWSRCLADDHPLNFVVLSLTTLRLRRLASLRSSALPLQVRELLLKRVRDSFLHPQFNTDVMKPLNIEALIDQEVCPP